MLALEQYGVLMRDISESYQDAKRGGDVTDRRVVISIPYESLRDNKDVQVAFQDLVTISTTP
jgi:hypothetical protein